MLLAMLFLGIMSMEAKNEKQPTYLYGFATSFNDSTVYFAEIQLLDDAWVDSKTKFLYGRDSYSYQLRDYLKAKGLNAPTCVTGFANTKKKAEEKFLKLRNKYLAKGKFNLSRRILHQGKLKKQRRNLQNKSRKQLKRSRKYRENNDT